MYDKQDVALSVYMQKQEEGSQLVIKAMSDKQEKLTDILKDISDQCNDIKSDTELIKEYSEKIEDLIEKTDDIEQFLIKRLGTDWDKIKSTWEDYKTGKINKKKLVMQGIKVIGKKFVKIFVKQI